MAFARIMCFGGSNKDDPNVKKSRDIERQLREDQKRMEKEVKLLLLGAMILEKQILPRIAKKSLIAKQVRESPVNRRY